MKIGKKKMIYDRGRYKEEQNKGSVNENKQSWLAKIFYPKKKIPREVYAAHAGDRGIGSAISQRAKDIKSVEDEIDKLYR